MNQNTYQENFVSLPVIALVILSDILILITFGPSVTAGLFSLITTVVFLLFFSFQIEASGSAIYYRFGIGLISGSYSANSIQRCDIKDNDSFFSWFYNPRGEHSLIVILRDRKIIRFPAREPKKFINHLQSKV